MRLTAKPLILALILIVSYGTQLQAFETSQATTPDPRLYNYWWMSLSRWYQMHSEDVAQATAGEAPLLFIGDSITEGWAGEGRQYWQQYFAPLGAANFGIGGDMTQNLLWRLQHGSVGSLNPSAVVLLIGVNNLGFTQETPEAISQGITEVVDALESHFPNAAILLLAIFPAGETASDPYRGKIKQINQGIAPLAEREAVMFIDLDGEFIETNGSISASVMPDYLHLSEEGYRRWAEAILPWVNLQFDVTKKE
jgi:lysophospholipase L1-like esterase